jgi:hypothetical protein
MGKCGFQRRASYQGGSVQFSLKSLFAKEVTGPQPSRHVRRKPFAPPWKGAAPLSAAEEQTARTISAYAQYAFLLSL